MINEYYDAPRKVLYAKNVTEPIVIKHLKNLGYIVKDTTRDDDFNGIDIIIESKKNPSLIITIDAKCSENKNQGSKNFLYTTISNNYKSYKTKKTDYVIYLNKNDVGEYDLVCISFKDNSELAESSPMSFKSKWGPGRYVLINKEKVIAKQVDLSNL